MSERDNAGDDTDLAGERRPRAAAQLSGKAGILPRQDIRNLVHRKVLQAKADFDPGQFQPASLDLRLGAKAFRVRASFLPGAGMTVAQKLADLKSDEIDLEHGAVLERGCVYVVELHREPEAAGEHLRDGKPEELDRPPRRLHAAHRRPQRRLRRRAGGLRRPALRRRSRRAASASRSRRGSRLNQIRFRRWNSQQDYYSSNVRLTDRELERLHAAAPLVDGDLKVRNGLILHIELRGIGEERLVGYRAQRHTDLVDVDAVGAYRFDDFWEPIRARGRQLILDPNEFYILASKERLHIPADMAAEMVPIDPTMGEFRVHYAGFFDPGFGSTAQGHPGSRGVLEVRSHEVPFVLDDGQMVCRLAYERMADTPDSLYGQIGTSNYQGQDLKLSKHFRMG